MKRILLLLGLFLLTPVALTAKPTALAGAYVFEPQKFLTRKIVHAQPVNVLVQVPYHPAKQRQYEAYVQQLYDTWFQSTADIIRASGRTEFNDLLPLLSKPVNIHFISNEENADLKVVFASSKEVTKSCGLSATGCVDIYRQPMFMMLKEWEVEEQNFNSVPTMDDLKSKHALVHLHETGHTLGLADQYYRGRNTNADVNYASPVHEDSVMHSWGSNAKAITPDDADGLVLALDVASGKKDRGGEKGWKSLNPESDLYYVHGKVGNSPHSFLYTTDKNFLAHIVLSKYDRNGTLREVIKLPFARGRMSVFDELKETKATDYDNLGRPVVEEGPDGQIIYTSYLYESIQKLSVQDDEVLRYEITLFAEEDHAEMREQTIYAGEPDGLVKLEGTLFVNEVSYDKLAWGKEYEVLESVWCNPAKCQRKSDVRTAWEISPAEREKLFGKLQHWLKEKMTWQYKQRAQHQEVYPQTITYRERVENRGY